MVLKQVDRTFIPGGIAATIRLAGNQHSPVYRCLSLSFIRQPHEEPGEQQGEDYARQPGNPKIEHSVVSSFGSIRAYLFSPAIWFTTRRSTSAGCAPETA